MATVQMPVQQSYGFHEVTVSFVGDQGQGLPAAKVTRMFLVLWEHNFVDSGHRMLVNTITNELQFTAPGDWSEVKHDPNMTVETSLTGEKVIRINYTDEDLTVVGEFYPDSGRFAATVLTPDGVYVLKAT